MSSRLSSVLECNDKLEALFQYTSGRWLIDEKIQQKSRYVRFDLKALCHIAAACFGSSVKCTSIAKMEGSFNKAFLLTMNDGKELIAKIPCPNSGPPFFTTASEVATLKFLRSETTIPVPEVLAWSAEHSNEAGTEYIIMEYIQGVTLSSAWQKMSTNYRCDIIEQAVHMQKELSGMKFPAYGSLYLRESLPGNFQQYPLGPELDPEGLFCIGASCQQRWWPGNIFNGHKTVPVELDAGPWLDISEYSSAMINQESAKEPDDIRRLFRSDKPQSTDEYKSLLRKAGTILQILSSDSRVAEVSDPVLWHHDLHAGNILVSRDQPCNITGLIDWQSSEILPLFIQARFPDFVRPPKGYTYGPQMPRLPERFDTLSPTKKQEATRVHELALASKRYELFCYANNKHVYNAMKLDRRFWKPFVYCHLPPHGSLVPLRQCLIDLHQDWSLLGLPDNCPFLISDDELRLHRGQKSQHENMLHLLDLVKQKLCTNDVGWVPIREWEATKKTNERLLQLYIESTRGQLTPQEAAKHWPFPPQRVIS